MNISHSPKIQPSPFGETKKHEGVKIPERSAIETGDLHREKKPVQHPTSSVGKEQLEQPAQTQIPQSSTTTSEISRAKAEHTKTSIWENPESLYDKLSHFLGSVENDEAIHLDQILRHLRQES